MHGWYNPYKSMHVVITVHYHGDAVVTFDDARRPSRSVAVTTGGSTAQPNHT